MYEVWALLGAALAGGAIGACLVDRYYQRRPEFTSEMNVNAELLLQEWATARQADGYRYGRDVLPEIDSRTQYLHDIGLISPSFWPQLLVPPGWFVPTPNGSECRVVEAVEEQ